MLHWSPRAAPRHPRPGPPQPAVLKIVASPGIRAWIRGPGSIRQTLSNAGVGILFLGSQLLLRGTLIAVFAGVAALVPDKLPPGAPWSFVVAFFLLDFVDYVQHRIEHAAPLLRAIHSVHHQSRDYNLSVSFRVEEKSRDRSKNSDPTSPPPRLPVNFLPLRLCSPSWREPP